jgi:hypothetical protein
MKKIQFPKIQVNLPPMRPAFAILFTCALALPLAAEVKRAPRKSLLDSEPGVVYLEQASVKPLELKVIREAPVFSDKEGKHQLGTLVANQITARRLRADAIDWNAEETGHIRADLVEMRGELWSARCDQ